MAGMCRLKASLASCSGHLAMAAAPPLMRLLRLAFPRPYGAAAAAVAQPLLDQERHYCYQITGEHRSDCLGAAAMADSEGSVPTRGVQWVFIGSPVAKRHVFAEKLSKLLEVPHISIGSLVRQELSPRSSLYKQIADAVNQGKLVPEDIMLGLLSKRLEDGYCRGESGFILDGFPRTWAQAEILDQIEDIDLVVNFKDCLVNNRRHSIFSQAAESHGISSCDSVRFDKPSAHMQSDCLRAETESLNEMVRLDAKQGKSLEDYYRKQKKLLDFQVGRGPAETWHGLLAALQMQHINAVHSTQKLTPGSSWL